MHSTRTTSVVLAPPGAVIHRDAGAGVRVVLEQWGVSKQ